MKKKKAYKGHPDKFIFQDMNKFQPQHRDSLLKHMKDLMVRIKEGNITVEETEDRFTAFANQVKNLINHYNQNQEK